MVLLHDPADVCLTDDLKVDPTRTPRFYGKLHQIIDHTYNHFRTVPTGLTAPHEQTTYSQMHSIVSELQQLDQTVRHDDEGNDQLFQIQRWDCTICDYG